MAASDGIFFQRLPFPGSDHLIWIGAAPTAENSPGLSQSQYDALERRSREQLVSTPFMQGSVTLRTEEGAERVATALVGGQFFDILGVRALRGRLLNQEDGQGGEPVVVLSAGLWHRALRSDPGIVGSLVTLDGRSRRVVGVVATGQGFPLSGTDIWMPLAQTYGPMLWSSDAPMLSVLARVPSGARLSPATALHFLSSELRQLPKPRVMTGKTFGPYVAQPLLEHLVGDMRPAMLALAIAAAFLMAIACLAAATIQLAANAARERDLAIRMVLGASVSRLWRSFGAEIGATAALSAMIGLALSEGALHYARNVGAAVIPELGAIHINAAVFLTAALFAALSALTVSIVPLIVLVRSSLEQSLRHTNTSMSTSKRGANLRDALIAVSLGATLLLVLASVVAADTLLRLVRVDTGFGTRGVVSATVRLPYQYVTPVEAQKIRSFVRSVEGTLPRGGPEDALAVTTDVPGEGTRSVVMLQNVGVAGDQRQLRAGMSQVSGEYFRMLHVPLLQGRTFAKLDDERGPPVVMLDAEAARRLYGGTDPVGRDLMLVDLHLSARVVGVVGSVRQGGRLAERLPQIYLPFDQLPLSTVTLLMRGSGSLASDRKTISDAARSASPDAAVASVLPLEKQMYDEVRRPQFYAFALSLFAIVALVVSAASVYASVAALVAQRTHEIGIRLALGASVIRVTAFVMGRVGLMMALGTLLGIVASLGLWRTLAHQGLAVGTATPGAIIGTALILWCVGGAAVVVPVGRATRIDPMVAFKE